MKYLALISPVIVYSNPLPVSNFNTSLSFKDFDACGEEQLTTRIHFFFDGFDMNTFDVEIQDCNNKIINKDDFITTSCCSFESNPEHAHGIRETSWLKIDSYETGPFFMNFKGRNPFLEKKELGFSIKDSEGKEVDNFDLNVAESHVTINNIEISVLRPSDYNIKIVQN